MRTMTLEQTASLRADVIKLNPLIAYNPPRPRPHEKNLVPLQVSEGQCNWISGR
jgi:hypothetical protein